MSTPRLTLIHAGAWWLWALALGVTATRTSNPILLVLIAVVSGYVTIACRTAAPWSRAYGTFLRLAAVVLVIRVVFHIVFGGIVGPTVWFTLPEVPLPSWAAGIRLGGAVSAEGVLFAAYDGMRLGVLLICVGAANSLADPRRLLQSLPAALYEISVAVVVALTTAPQLVVSAGRIRRARKLRGSTARGIGRFTSLLVPVIEDAFDRSLAMAATMDARGYGRTVALPRRDRVVTGIGVIGGLGALAIGAYGSLDPTMPDALGLPMVALGVALATVGLRTASRRINRTRYRPDGWGRMESAIAGSGVAAVVGIVLAERAGAAGLVPAFTPISIPAVPVTAVIGVVCAVAPAFLARTDVVPARVGRITAAEVAT